MDMARAVGINHIALEVGSLDEALEFYGRLFDVELRGRVRGMAFVDMGDQSLALATPRSGEPDVARHVGIVVDDKEAVRAAALAEGLEVSRPPALDFHDPWGNYLQLVDYREIQFTKTTDVLAAMGHDGLGKSESALAELRAKGIGVR